MYSFIAPAGTDRMMESKINNKNQGKIGAETGQNEKQAKRVSVYMQRAERMEINSSRDVNFKPVHRGEKKGDVQQLSYTTDFLGWVAYSHKNLQSVRFVTFW